MSPHQLFEQLYQKSNETADRVTVQFIKGKVNLAEIRKINVVLSEASAAGRELENILKAQEIVTPA